MYNLQALICCVDLKAACGNHCVNAADNAERIKGRGEERRWRGRVMDKDWRAPPGERGHVFG